MTTHRLRNLSIAVALGLAATAIPSPAVAATIELTAGADPVAEVGVPVRVTGLADRDAHVEIRSVRRSADCDGSDHEEDEWFDAGPFELSGVAEFDEPGTYTLCGVVDTLDGRPPVVTAVPITVRPPRTVVGSVRAPGIVPLDAPVTVAATGAGDAPRHVTTVLARPGTDCREADGLGDSVGGADVVRAGRWTSAGGGDLDEYGRWTACVVIRREFASDPVEQVIAAPVVVSASCTRATLLAAEAKEAWAVASAAGASRPGPWRLLGAITGAMSRCDPVPAERRSRAS
ncbi:hypothetical protein DSM112329_02253 [Paraconexibacter sp. AEG42_29]|uniref:Uncharacterized protein n=1 Tax=Paraconexibacter sp. AEG42_29 TaxID=2997339 RepID=A0AAU7AUP5_9ACTN